MYRLPMLASIQEKLENTSVPPQFFSLCNLLIYRQTLEIATLTYTSQEIIRSPSAESLCACASPEARKQHYFPEGRYLHV